VSRASTFTLAPADDGVAVLVHRWEPAGGAPRAVVAIAHGLAEHAMRYARLAVALTAAGYAVYAHDHRGHGRTARGAADLGTFADADGWRRVVADVGRVLARARGEHPGAPVVLFGHSMGSFVVQDYLCTYGATLAAAVLCGSSVAPDLPELLALARSEHARLGRRVPSPALAAATFGGFNQAFQPSRTDFDWLSRDPAEVDAYVADPLCGFAATPCLWIDILEAAPALRDPARLARIPRDLPLYVMAGTADPVNAGMTGLEHLLALYRAAGLRRVTTRFYEDARHEILNETNRHTVTADLLAWLDEVVPART
jgi:alpha-beta hydrolase superfamily lysophospholipase